EELMTQKTKRNGEGAAELAKTVDRKIAYYQSTLSVMGRMLPTDLRIAVAATRTELNATGIIAMEVLVDTYLAGNAHTSQTMVVGKFEERMRIAESAIPTTDDTKPETETPSRTIRAKAALNEARTLVKEQE